MSTYTFEGLARMRPAQLTEIIRGANAPDLDGLVGWEFRGWNVVAPIGEPVVALLGIRRFAKGFYQRKDDKKPSEGGQLLGYNVDIQRGGLEDEWVGKPSAEAPRRRAFYTGHAPGEGARLIPGYEHTLFLDYTARNDVNGVFDGGGLFGDGGLRDFVVQPDPENPDLLIGKAFYRLPPLTVDGGVFIAQRWRRFDFEEPS